MCIQYSQCVCPLETRTVHCETKRNTIGSTTLYDDRMYVEGTTIIVSTKNNDYYLMRLLSALDVTHTRHEPFYRSATVYRT